jgi:hypothetical protein
MCGQTVAHYQERADAKPNQDVLDATLEAALIHARILMFFLGWDRGDKASHDDDVIVEDFSPSAVPGSLPKAVPATFKIDADKRLGHLTYTRDGGPKVLWNLVDIAIAIRNEMLRVMHSVSRTSLHDAWLPLLDEARGPTALDAVRDQVAGSEASVATGTVYPYVTVTKGF